MIQTVQSILDRIQNEYVNNEGLLSETYPPSNKHLLNDFNDYIPFLLFFKCDHFVEKQISIAKVKAVNGLIPVDSRIISWRQDEWIEAIGEIYKIKKDTELFNLIENGLKYIQNKLIEDGFIKAFYNLKSKVSPHVFDPRTGALLETLLDLGDDFPLATDLAITCLDRVLDWSSRNKQFLIPNFIFINNSVKTKVAKINFMKLPKRYVYPYVRGWRSPFADFMIGLPFASEIKLTKQNSNLIHAFLRAYESTGENRYLEFVKRWMREFIRYMYENGKCYSSPKKDLVKLSHNHPVIDICLELYRLTAIPGYLNMAIRIIDFWLTIRLTNGLFPEFEGSSFSHLDHQTDMIVILTKIAGISDKPEYLETAETIFKALIKNHKTEKGFITYLNSRNSKDSKRGVIHPKYNALFLKAFIALKNSHRVLDDNFWKLLRDR